MTTTMTDDDDLQAAIAAHERLRDAAREIMASGIEPTIVMHAMLTTATDGLLQVEGRVRTLRALLECYIPIRNAVVRDDGAPPMTRQ